MNVEEIQLLEERLGTSTMLVRISTLSKVK